VHRLRRAICFSPDHDRCADTPYRPLRAITCHVRCRKTLLGDLVQIYGAVTRLRAAVQHRYLQTKFLIVLIGFPELPALSRRFVGSRTAAILGSCFDGVSAITMAQYVL
jgi:hypothetical protein